MSLVIRLHELAKTLNVTQDNVYTRNKEHMRQSFNRIVISFETMCALTTEEKRYSRSRKIRKEGLVNGGGVEVYSVEC